MGLTSSLSVALSGLKITEAGLNVVSSNVANAGNPNYTRQRLVQQTIVDGHEGASVMRNGVQRMLNETSLNQLRTQNSAFQALDLESSYRSRIDTLFGTPGSAAALDTIYNKFDKSLQTLATKPEDFAARAGSVAAADSLASRLRSMSSDIQSMRMEAEQSMAEGVKIVNDALGRLASLDRDIVSQSVNGMPAPELLDARDAAINTISEWMDVRVNAKADGSVSLFTESGTLLYDDVAAQLSFDAKGVMTPQTTYSTDDAARTVGTLTLKSPNGTDIDLFKQGALRTGKFAGFKAIRDDVTVEAQKQLDEFAAQLSKAMSSVPVAATDATDGAKTGKALDLSSLQPGDEFSVTVTEGGTEKTYTFITSQSKTGALPGNTTARAGDQVFALDMSGNDASIAAQVQAALGGNFTAAYSGGSLSIVDDGAAGTSDVNAMSGMATARADQPQAGGKALALFVDGGNGKAFTGSLDDGDQKQGLAARLEVNSAVKKDPALLVKSGANTANGDTARPQFLYDQLHATTRTFDARTGLGGEGSPLKGDVGSYLNRMVSYQGQAATNAKSFRDGQEVITNSLKARHDKSAKVNVDEEMANLIQLQQAYAANARIVKTVDEMLKTLMQI